MTAMKVFLIIFMIISSLTSIGTMSFVVYDVIEEKRAQKRAQGVPIPVPCPVPTPQPTVEEPVVIPEVESIDAEEADQLLDDTVAMRAAKTEKGAGSGPKTLINIGVIDRHFAAGETVTLSALKAKGCVPRQAGRIKILADGVLTKPLTVKAESFSIQAIKMIELTGGTVILLK